MFTFKSVFLFAALGLSKACTTSLPASPNWGIPTWSSENFTCTGPHIPWEVRFIPGKGIGMFAIRSLDPGDVILKETPTLRVTPPMFHEGVGYNLTHFGVLIRQHFNALSVEDQAAVMDLFAYRMPIDDKLDELVSIFRTNAYIIGTNNTDMGVFPKGARINHSCRPNTSHYWNEKEGKRTVYAARHIEDGEELTATYVQLLQSHNDRQKSLEQYGFTCTCEVCAQEHAAQEASDKRRKDIGKAFAAFSSQLSLAVPKSRIARTRAEKNAKASVELANLVEEEGLLDFYAQAYRIVAISHARVEAWRPATVWAHKSYELWSKVDSQSPASLEMFALTSQFILNWNEEVKNNKSMRTN